MAKSKQRKGHKQKAQKYSASIKAGKAQQQKKAIEKYLKEQQARMEALNTQKEGEVVENTDIEVDLDI